MGIFSCKSCKKTIFSARFLQDKHFLLNSDKNLQDKPTVSSGVGTYDNVSKDYNQFEYELFFEGGRTI